MATLDILAIGAHPDDVELSAGGTIAKHVSMGMQVGILDLTQGEMGTRGTPQKRYEEAMRAKEILGLAVRDQIHLPDGYISTDKESKRQVIQKIRQYRPRIILANAINDRHPDHGNASRLVTEACFLSGLAKISTQYNGQEQTPWRPLQVYHYIQFYPIEPDFVVDISDHIEIKEQAIRAYDSQFYKEGSKEPETLIAQKNFLENIRARAGDWGIVIGKQYGEGFTTERYIGVDSLTDLL